jgi:hypothetical protein
MDVMRIAEKRLKLISDVEKQLFRLKHVPEIKRLLADLQKERVNALNQIDRLQRETAHHALFIQLSDGSWHLIDPYFGIQQEFKYRNKSILRYLDRIDNKSWGMNLWIPLNNNGLAYLEAIARLKVAIKFVKPYIAKVNRRKVFVDDEIENMAYTIALFCLGLTEEQEKTFDPKLATTAQKKVFSHIYFILSDYCYLPASVRKSSQLRVQKGQNGLTSEQCKEYALKAKKDRERYKRAQWKILRGVVQLMLEQTYLMTIDKDARAHELVDIGHPTIALASATLNHMRSKTGMHINGRLVIHTSSQWIIHDTLAAAERGDVMDLQSRRAVKKHIKRITKNGPQHTLGALKPYLQKDW